MQNNDSEIPTIHDNWIKHPMTQAGLRAIKEHASRFSKALVRDATDPNVTDEQVRMNAVGLKTCDAIMLLLSTPGNFKLTQQELLNTQ